MGMYLDADDVPRVYRVVIQTYDATVPTQGLTEDDTYTVTIYEREVEGYRAAVIKGFREAYNATVTVDIYPA